MQSKDRITIQKIIKYINEVKEYVGEMKAVEFLKDKKTMTACAFSVSQIGELAKEIQSFVSSSIDYLSNSINKKTPEWAMSKKYRLEEPFFPSNLKGEIRAVMLIESPIEYKVRNIYVLGNVLTRC